MDTSVRVLYVDNEPTFGEVVAEYLEREADRIEVLTEPSASAGLARLEDDDDTFDCVVSDYDMPEMNGIEFLEAVRNKRPDLPFILFTGKGSEEIARDAFAAGATDYLQKSSGTDQYTVLANRILNAYDGYRAERKLREMTDLYETTLNNMSDTVLITDDDGSFTYICPNVQAIFGYSPEEITDFGTVDALFEERLFDRLELEATGEISNIETEITDKSGDRRTVLVSVKQVSIQDGTWLYSIRDITDRKERERELELRGRAMAEAPVGITITDADQDENPIVYVNDRFEELTGYDAEEALGQHCRFLQGEDTDIGRTVEMRESIERGEPVSVTLRNYRKDGTEFWNRVTMAPVRADEDEITHYVGFQQDVTDRKERERELRRYERMVDTMLEAACIYTEDARFDFVNEYLADFYETAREELEGRKSNLIPMVREQREGDPFEELLSGEREEISGEVAGEFPEAGYQVLDYRLTPLVIDGEIEGVVGVTREITERRERERELKQTNALLSTLFETLPVGVLAEDEQRNILAVNERFFELFGIQGEPEDVIGVDCEQLAREASELFVDSEDFVDRIRELIERREPVNREDLRLVDGRTFTRSYQPIELADGDGHLWVYRDVTERKEQERTLRHERDRLDEFASVVSHDLRNPLHVAQGRLELAREETDSEHHGAIADALDRMETLIEDLLALAREGETVREREPIELPDLVDSCWRNVTSTNATIRTETDLTVSADRSRLRQLLENLFSNAIEHGGESVTVTVGDLDGGFYVEDDGPGIPPEKRERVFDVGFSTSVNGTGFGLSIVEEVAEAHGWDVRVTRSSTGGARFEITGIW
ncbi:MAG: PAS domain S-box protein [Halapricum sp.]